MKKSPGHRKWPDHEVREEPVRQTMRIEVNGTTVADSDDVIRLVEDDHPDRYYFPRSDVAMDTLEMSDRETQCPFKGRGRYFDLRAGGQGLDEAAWSYEEPYREHGDLENRIAFHDHELRELEVSTRG